MGFFFLIAVFQIVVLLLEGCSLLYQTPIQPWKACISLICTYLHVLVLVVLFNKQTNRFAVTEPLCTTRYYGTSLRARPNNP